ncbi:MAG: class I SAM-dependent methyltransferase [Tannerellaceae bacterium]|nr:class I SAM-dependent methyltransferase [Tannerellaceae bacterium]
MTLQFIREHAGDDLNRLLLNASRYPEVDMPFVVEQIAIRRQVREKLPLWCANEGVIFPSRLAAEQSSSEQAARYKQRLAAGLVHVCDLTGGMGVDSFFLSRVVERLTYIERNGAYCDAARQNFAALNAPNITVWEGDAAALLPDLPETGLFYIDPARRGKGDKRLFALQDCEPDLQRLAPVLLERAPAVVAKLSPMADISHTLSLLPATVEVHVLAVRNEVKELLFVMKRGGEGRAPVIRCVHFTTAGKEEAFSFLAEEEKAAPSRPAPRLMAYLYEPNASILKAGAFKRIAFCYGVEKLHVNSHLYTSDRLVEDFPGRIFEVEEAFPFSGKRCKTLAQYIPQANITTRNFPLTAEALRQRTKIRDGGEAYLFATTTAKEGKVLIKCRKPAALTNRPSGS